MSSILPVKLSISSSLDLNPFSLLLSSSHLTQVFQSPFADLSVQLLNFPSYSDLSLKFFRGEICEYETSADLSPLVKASELSFKCKLHQQGSNEDTKSTETVQVSNNEITLKIIRPDIEKNSFSLQLDEFNSINEKVLEISLKSLEKNKNKIEFKSIDPGIIDLADYQEISPQVVKNIKWLLLGVNSKLKLFQVLVDNLEETRTELEKEKQERLKAMKRLQEACSGFMENERNFELKIKNLEEENKELREKSNFLIKTEKAFEDFKVSKDSELDLLSLKLLAVSTSATSLPESNQSSSVLPQNSSSDQSSLLTILQEHSNLISQYQSSIDSLTEANSALHQENQALFKENNFLHSSLSLLSTQSTSLQSQVLEFQSQSTYTLELESQLGKLESELSKVTESNSELQGKLKTSTFDLQTLNQTLYAEKLQLIEANSKLNQDLASVKMTLIETEKRLLDIQSKTYESTQESSISLTEITKQNLQLLQDSKDFCEVSNKLEKNMLHEYQVVVLSLMQISSQHLMLQRLMSKILVFVRDKEAEILELRNVMGEIQKQKVTYVPVRGDFIDNQLANFLNSMAVPCEVPFTRLEPGVYLFGSKRVVLRVENIGIVIRVGGGFIKLEDYINNQSVFEVGRMKLKEAKEQENKKRNSKPSSPAKYEVDRNSSPNVNYAKRNSLMSGIPIPKNVSTLADKKSSIDLNFLNSDKKSTQDSSIPIFCKRNSSESAVNSDKNVFENLISEKKGSVDYTVPNLDGMFSVDSSSLIKPIPIEDAPEKKSRLELTKKSFLTRKNTTG